MSSMDQYPNKLTFWRNVLISAFCGIIFTAGWCIFIDAAVVYKKDIIKHKGCILPGIGSTLAFIFLWSIPYPIRTSYYVYYERTYCTGKLLWALLFLALVSTFGAFIWSLYVWIVEFMLPGDVSHWPGIAICIQNLCIASANLLFKFSLKYTDSYY